ncbi:MAG: M15 family metallopeptidase [Bacteroidaceae bacterium]|nr:M15 family metallopeptidase [Bacteroidaceae bacterium]
MNKLFSFMLLALTLVACKPTGESHKSALEQELEQIGLQNVAEQIPGIEVYMVYATPYNFMGRVLYTGLDEAYLVPEAVEKLRKANELLRQRRLDLHLVVYDAARPRSIQQQMWKVVENTELQDFVANPNKSGGGPHNYGVAVDVTLVDCTGHPIPMGSEYDYFGDRSRVDLEDQLIATGEINQRELLNRQLLRDIMTEAGWLVEPSEWWHFNAMLLTEASERLEVIK